LIDNSYSTYYLSRGSLDMRPLITYRSFVRLLLVVSIRRGKLNFPVLPLSCRQTPSVSVFRASFFLPHRYKSTNRANYRRLCWRLGL